MDSCSASLNSWISINKASGKPVAFLIPEQAVFLSMMVGAVTTTRWWSSPSYFLSSSPHCLSPSFPQHSESGIQIKGLLWSDNLKWEADNCFPPSALVMMNCWSREGNDFFIFFFSSFFHLHSSSKSQGLALQICANSSTGCVYYSKSYGDKELKQQGCSNISFKARHAIY